MTKNNVNEPDSAAVAHQRRVERARGVIGEHRCLIRRNAEGRDAPR